LPQKHCIFGIEPNLSNLELSKRAEPYLALPLVFLMSLGG